MDEYPVTLDRIEKYLALTEKALGKVSIIGDSESENYAKAQDILEMVGSYIHPRFISDYLKGSFFRLWKESEGEQMYPLGENESHVIRYLENK